MDPVNDTLTDELAQAPPDNPMYAGGIAVLVAFVLFMYWGSLNEKDDSKDGDTNKKKDRIHRQFKESDKPHKKKKRKKKRTGVYSVSDAMEKQLLCDTGQEQSCAECEQCPLQKYEMKQHQRGSSSVYDTNSLTKSTQTNTHSNNQRVARSVSSVRNVEQKHKNLPQRPRAHSSPDLVANSTPNTGTCTCVRPAQNGGSLLRPQRELICIPPDEQKMRLVTFCERDCERTAEIETGKGHGKGSDSIHYEQETKKSPADSENSHPSAVVQKNGKGGKGSGKVLRKLDDAFVRLEGHPNVTIDILAETVK